MAARRRGEVPRELERHPGAAAPLFSLPPVTGTGAESTILPPSAPGSGVRGRATSFLISFEVYAETVSALASEEGLATESSYRLPPLPTDPEGLRWREDTIIPRPGMPVADTIPV